MISDVRDLMTKIFLLLPTKTLIRFKSVCRYWGTLISDPDFASSHTKNSCHSNHVRFLLHRPKASRYYLLHCSLNSSKRVYYRFPADIVSPTICSVSNGLFLLETTSPESCHVYNPTTRQSRSIPLTAHGVYNLRVGMAVAFDPLESPDFKIICMRASRSSGMSGNLLRSCRIEVYDSKTNTWRYHGNKSVPVTWGFVHGFSWNNVIYWSKIAFDLKTLVQHFLEVNGDLNYIEHSRENKSIEVFELDVHKDWVSKFRLVLAKDKAKLSVVGMYWEEKEGDNKLVVYDCETGKVMTCGFEEKVFKELDGVKVKLFYRNSARHDSRFSFPFLETLAHV